MTIEGLHNYLSARLPLQLKATQHFRLLATVFALVFASTVVIHVLIQEDKTLLGMLVHATTIGLVYVTGIGLATMFLYAIRDATQGVRVWHIWLASMVGFVLGYYFLPTSEFLVWLLGIDTGEHAGPLRFSQLLPVWFLVTYLFVNPYLHQGLRSELVRLKDVNELLRMRDLTPAKNGDEMIRFESGRTQFRLSANTIRNIFVDDHYCYVNYRHGDGYEKRDLGMPLRDVQTLLPPVFVQVHRSHIVNLKYVVSIRRKNRSLRVILDGGYEVPVSRHRLDEVLPLLRRNLRDPS
ncbi:MAG: LytTR family DNA-binding domain-containing protein [Woeseiaceae bacterium]